MPQGIHPKVNEARAVDRRWLSLIAESGHVEGHIEGGCLYGFLRVRIRSRA
jgi:hypothetical protein